MARQKDYRTSRETQLITKYQNSLINYRKWQAMERGKEEPDAGKIKIWQAKIDYYEERIEKLPKEMDLLSKTTEKEKTQIKHFLYNIND